MRVLVMASTLALLITPAFAQSSSNAGSQSSQTNQNSTEGGQTHNIAAAQKLKQSLQKEGFTDVKIVAQSFVVQGKSPDGDPVVMTIGPRGMSVFEAMNATGSGETTGSSGSNSSAATNNPNNSNSPASSPNSQTEK